MDLKGLMRRSADGFHYALFAVEEHTRFVFVEFLKTKEAREEVAAAARIVGRFNALVGAGSDADGRPLPKPAVRVFRHDHEAGMESSLFDRFRADLDIGQVTSPPHDHDLNPIAERCIGSVSTLATSISSDVNMPPTLWTYAIEHAVNIHNCTTGAVGSSTANPLVTPHQRLTLEQPNVMDLASFLCRAVVLKAPEARLKSQLSARGFVGEFLGRSRGCPHGTQLDVLANGRIVHSSSVQIDEECTPRLGSGSRRPLLRGELPEAPDTSRGGANAFGKSNRDALCLLNLYSGPYARAEGLSQRLREHGWSSVVDIDNDPDTSGGWNHDLLNDELYAALEAKAHNGDFDAVMIAFPCTTFSTARLFPVDPPGPPPVRSKRYPDGLPDDALDPRYKAELSKTQKLLDRTVALAIAARKSPRRSTIILENPADRSVRGTPQFGEDTKDHGSLFATSAFSSLRKEIPDSSLATFAYCRLGSEYQKYTTLFYTNDAAPILDQLSGPLYKCNHTKHPKVAGGRLPGGV